MGKITKISGPLVIAEGVENGHMFDLCKVGKDKLIGEIIEIHGEKASIQVYEETAGIYTGEDCVSTGAPLSVELAPGLIKSIYDGIQRPLDEIKNKCGNNIKRGVEVNSVSREKKWLFTPTVSEGDVISAGDIIGTVPETSVVTHKVMLPFGLSGKVKKVYEGEFTVTDTVLVIDTEEGEKEVCMLQKWPVRRGRPYAEKLPPEMPLITGQRCMDCMFPIAKGGVAAIPGPFGSGKTVTQHQLAKWADADIVIYIGCGERGNEMTDVLNEFPELRDPKTGKTLMERTVLIANTSDMPVAAREASIYTGITIGEYFRDMGYSVVLLADSTSRWAEALREMSGRLEEMPGEEGYPAYLGSRLAGFYERAGFVRTLGKDGRLGSLSVVGAVSPPGGDISEPVCQATMRIVKVFWGLDSNLAYKRHFPTVNWLKSYSLYLDSLEDWYKKNADEKWMEYRGRMMSILQDEAKLEEIVKLVGMDSLSKEDRLKMETARSIREDFLQQEAFDEIDTHASINKMLQMMKLVLLFNDTASFAISHGADIEKVSTLAVREQIGRFKYVPEEKVNERFEELKNQIEKDILNLCAKEEN